MADETTPRKSTSRSAKSSRRLSAEEIVQRATRVLSDLGGMDAERVIGVEPDNEGDGWRVMVEVVELRRVPDTADVLAIYEVSISTGGQFLSYRQVDRHLRGRVEGPR